MIPAIGFAVLLLLQPPSGADAAGLVTNQAGNPIGGIQIDIGEPPASVVTDLSGRFRLDRLPSGLVRFRIRSIGYAPVDTLIRLPALDIRIRLVEQENGIVEFDVVTVQGERWGRDLAQSAPLTTERIGVEKLRLAPRLGGEPDPIRLLHQLPGVQAESDFSGGYTVRGGRPDQNLLLLDGMPLYHTGHLFGVFSALNAEAVGGMTFARGVFPAAYGGRLSSVLDVRLKRPSTTGGAVYLGMLSTSASVETVQGGSSLMAAFRRTHMDPVLAAVDRRDRKSDPVAGVFDPTTSYVFSDWNLGWSHRLAGGHLLSGQFFRNTDRFGYEVRESYDRPVGTRAGDFEALRDTVTTGMDWGVDAASMRLDLRPGSWTAALTGWVLDYRASSRELRDNRFRYRASLDTRQGSQQLTLVTEEDQYYQLDKRFRQGVTDFGTRLDLEHAPKQGPAVRLSFGAIHHVFRQRGDLYELTDDVRTETTVGFPSKVFQVREELTRGTNASRPLTEVHASLDTEWKWHTLTWNGGLRVEALVPGSAAQVSPRVNLAWAPAPGLLVSAGYGRFRQYLHALGIDLVQIPLEHWVWAGDGVDPQDAETWTLGFRLGDQGTRWTTEFYTRTFTGMRMLDPEEVQAAVSGSGSFVPVYKNITIAGEGRAYGVENRLEYPWSRGYVAMRHSWAVAENRFEGIDEGRWFPIRNDIRHDAGLELRWELAERWSFGTDFRYRSGQPANVAVTGYDRVDDPLGVGELGTGDHYVWHGRNRYRLPDYHRLDLSLTWSDLRWGAARADWTLSVINIYDRRNVLAIRTATTIRDRGAKLVVEPNYRHLDQLPMLPMLSLRVRFGGVS